MTTWIALTVVMRIAPYSYVHAGADVPSMTMSVVK